MKTGRVKIFAYNSKGEEVSEVYRFETQAYMHFLDVLNILRRLTKYQIDLKGGLGKHGRKNHEVLTFEQLCKVVSTKVFKEKVLKTIVDTKAVKTEQFTFIAPENFYVSVDRTEWHETLYTFFTLEEKNRIYMNAIFTFNRNKLGLAKNGSLFTYGHYSVERDKSNPLLWHVYEIKNEIVNTTEVEAIITL